MAKHASFFDGRQIVDVEKLQMIGFHVYVVENQIH